MNWPPDPADFPRLKDTLVWVYEHSPHYRRVLDAAGVRPHALRTYDEYRTTVPKTEKTELVASQRANPPYGDFLAATREEFGSLHTSPGPIFIPRLKAEQGGTAVLKEAVHAMGVQPGEVAHITLSYHIMPGGLRLHRAFEEAGCLVINGGVGNSEMQVEVARAYRASVYAGTPSFLANLGDTARKMGLDPKRDLHYRKGFSTAEALTPKLRAELQDMFGIELFDHCGEAQIGPLAGECRMHDGMHVHAKDLFIEFLDPLTGEPVGPGDVGELVATLLGPRALPLVRYAPKDGFRLLAGACPCGDPSPRVVFVGQVGQIRKIKGVLVHPAQVQKVVGEFPELGRFQIIIEHPEGQRYDHATLRVATRTALPDAPGLARQLQERLKSTVLIQMDVTFVPESDVPEAAAGPRFAETMVDKRTHA
jgi:phenylacetate-CoA ligase